MQLVNNVKSKSRTLPGAAYTPQRGPPTNYIFKFSEKKYLKIMGGHRGQTFSLNRPL